jgi:hypothetical protein
MGWFSRWLGGNQKEEALTLVRHLQTMLAYQQLAMETYNDALTSVGGVIRQGTGVSVRTVVGFSSPALVAEKVIPALEKKIGILWLMEAKHHLASKLATGELWQPYQEMTSAIRALLHRADLQYQRFTKWVQSPQTSLDTSSLDRAELVAMYSAASALNDLIRRVGLTPEEWMDINKEAFNSVRVSIGLSPLGRDVFRSLYFRNLKGEPVRFFAE